MECFITEDGVERKAELKDVLPLLEDGGGLRRALMEAEGLSCALAHLPDEIKEKAYRNMSRRTGGELKKDVSISELWVNENSGYVREVRAGLMNLIGKYWEVIFENLPENIVWKEEKPKPSDPVKVLIKKIEKACKSGNLDISYSDIIEIREEDIRSAFAAFQNRPDELRKIRWLEIQLNHLDAAALLFEKGAVEELDISGGEFNDQWPPFLENCRTLTSINMSGINLTEVPSWLRNAVSLRILYLSSTGITSIPEWIGGMESLTELCLSLNDKLKSLPESIGNLQSLAIFSLIGSKNLKTLPDTIGDLKNLVELSLQSTSIETLPDSIGDLQSLKSLTMYDIENLKTLPDSIGNLKNLTSLTISNTSIETLPESIGNLQSLAELYLCGNKNLKTLPDCIGNLKNLAKLYLYNASIEKLPDTLINCTALESVDIFGAPIQSVPDFISKVKYFKGNVTIEYIPCGPLSYRCFCNSYYRLAETMLMFNDKARREGLLSLEDELEDISEGFLKQGIRLVVDGTDAEIIRHLLTLKWEREHDYYRKKLMHMAMEGILSIQNRDAQIVLASLLASLSDIQNNPIQSACVQYLSGDINALDNIDIKSAIQDEGEREEVRFIKRVMAISELSRREGLLALEEHLDQGGIATFDVFEYGLPFVIDNRPPEQIEKILSILVERVGDPIQKNLALAKKDAVLSINAGYNPRVIAMTLCAYFDESITKEVMYERY
jgi:Leucine-rich repeat (LRR) protein/flagellar motor component MotA